MSANGWIGVDFDGTLATYDKWEGPTKLGLPIPAMVDRVLRWLAQGKEVRIVTARHTGCGRPEHSGCGELCTAVTAIQQWCVIHLGRALPITNTKDYGMIELWDDRAIAVETNTGRILGGASRA